MPRLRDHQDQVDLPQATRALLEVQRPGSGGKRDRRRSAISRATRAAKALARAKTRGPRARERIRCRMRRLKDRAFEVAWMLRQVGITT